jgi:ABC-type cobalt transport system substrate-binding protein
MKNKDFIPEKFYDKKEANKNKNEKTLLIMILILNLILVPITTNSIRENKKTYLTSNDGINNDKIKKIDPNSIKILIESVIKDDIEEVYLTKNNGNLIVNNLERIEELSSNKFINIRGLNLNDDGKYNLVVGLNE